MAYQQLPPRNSLPTEYNRQSEKRIQRTVQRGPLLAQFGCGLIFVTGVMFLGQMLCTPDHLGVFGLAIVVPIFLGLCFLIWKVVRPLFRSQKISDPEVVLSSDILRVGEPFQFTLQQTVKEPLEIQSIRIILLMREITTYQQGTTTTTEKHEIVASSYERPGRGFQAGEEIQIAHQFLIPHDGMHTFIHKNNRIEWLIRAEVIISSWSSVKEEYMVHILPARYLAPETDSLLPQWQR